MRQAQSATGVAALPSDQPRAPRVPAIPLPAPAQLRATAPRFPMIPRQTAKGNIEVHSWETAAFDTAAGPSLNEIRVTEAFVGDITGTGSARMLQTLRADGSASFVAVERVEGTLDGRKGSFVLQDAGTLVGAQVEGSWFVVPGSGTGELAGLRGEGGFSATLGQHASYTLTYWFE
jgi:hypothetical protein